MCLSYTESELKEEPGRGAVICDLAQHGLLPGLLATGGGSGSGLEHLGRTARSARAVLPTFSVPAKFSD